MNKNYIQSRIRSRYLEQRKTFIYLEQRKIFRAEEKVDIQSKGKIDIQTPERKGRKVSPEKMKDKIDIEREREIENSDQKFISKWDPMQT